MCTYTRSQEHIGTHRNRHAHASWNHAFGSVLGIPASQPIADGSLSPHAPHASLTTLHFSRVDFFLRMSHPIREYPQAEVTEG